MRDAWRNRLRALHTYPTLTSAVNQYRYTALGVRQPPTTKQHPLSTQHRQELHASMVNAQGTQITAASPLPTNSPPAAASVGGPAQDDVWHGRPPVDPQGGLGVLLSGMGNRLHTAEQHTMALEARCSLLDSMLQQHLDRAQQDGVRTALQAQAQLSEVMATLQHLTLRVELLERRVASAVEEGEGRLESVLGALVHALRQHDVMAASESQLAEVRGAVAELARKLETVETVAGVGRVGSPQTPEGVVRLHGAEGVRQRPA